MAVEFWWWPMLPWLSPGAAWFIFFNIVVGAIAIMSRGEQGGRAPATRRKLVRTASTVVMERLRSISIFSFHSAADYGVASSPASQLGHIQDQYDYTSQEQEAEEERLLSRVATEIGKPKPAPAAGESGESATTAAPSAPVTTTAAAADAAESASESEEEEEAKAEDDEESISLDEAYALARQSHAQARQAPPAAVAAVADTVARSREREPAKLAGVKRRARMRAGSRGGGREGGGERARGAVHPAVPEGAQAAAPQLHPQLHKRAPPPRRCHTGTVAGAPCARTSPDRNICFCREHLICLF